MKIEFQSIANFLHAKLDGKDLTRFVTKKWIEVHDQTEKNNYSANKEILIKILML